MKRKQERALSPGRMTARRFFRNRLAVVGLGILLGMFLFSFLGGALSPYDQDQVFYRQEQRAKAWAQVSASGELRFAAAPGQSISALLKAQVTLAAARGEDSVQAEGKDFSLRMHNEDLYEIYEGNTLVGLAHRQLLYGNREDFDFLSGALRAYAMGGGTFAVGEDTFTVDAGGVIHSETGTVGYLSPLVIRAVEQTLSAGLLEAIGKAVLQNAQSISWEGEQLTLQKTPEGWQVLQVLSTRVWDAYAAPSWEHLLGTDKNGMDMLTRLMYGGRVSLVIGFVVVFIGAVLGTLLGGLAGYFGGWVDDGIMRLVDVFYCIPSTPLLIILGAAMDGMRVEAGLRMLLMMAVLGFLDWPGIARLIRGQLLTLREQEFMKAAEAVGLSTRRRLLRHLLPNVIPQLIVTCTMRLGSTILTEATLSFLGLGVKFPYASWGNIMNDVASAHVLTSYWFVWIPAGVCLVLAVLGFNFVGDGLRDAFDPKTKG